MRHLPAPIAILIAVHAGVAHCLAADTAIEIAARNIAARGGGERIRAVKSARATGTLALGDGQTAPFTYEWKHPNLVRLEFRTGGDIAVQAYDGMSAWAFIPFLGHREPQRLPRDMAELFELQSDFAGPLFDHAAKGHEVTFAGKVEDDGRELLRLELALRGGQLLTTYLDPETYLEVKQELRVVQPDRTIDVEVTLSDYREVGELILAHQVESRAKDGSSSQAMTFRTVELNVPIAADRFAMPLPVPAQ